MPHGNHKKYEEGTNKLMAEHGIPFHGANDVMYLRKQGLPEGSPQEQQLIQEYQQGQKPDVTKFVK